MELNMRYLYDYLSIRGYSPHFINNEIIQFRIENFTYLIDCDTDYFRIMMVNTNYLVPMTEANQNFSKVVRTVDESGIAVILKNNKPRYVVVDFEEYDTIAAAMQMRKAKIDSLANTLIDENIEALGELAK